MIIQRVSQNETGFALQAAIFEDACTRQHILYNQYEQENRKICSCYQEKQMVATSISVHYSSKLGSVDFPNIYFPLGE